MPEIDSKERFSNRVDNYVKFRPTYPAEAIDYIVAQAGCDERSVIADLGSGTGKFTRLFLERGLCVVAVEPNDHMRIAAENELSCFTNFRSVSASAEKTGLDDNSVDLITVAQAFHWFDRDICKTEFRRILKPDGCVCLIWNRRNPSVKFMAEYHEVVKRLHGEYPNAENEKTAPGVYDAFFDGNYEKHDIFWHQTFDFDSLWGRTQSSSYSPVAGHPNYEPLKAALRDLFERYNENGLVRFEYRTEVVIGRF